MVPPSSRSVDPRLSGAAGVVRDAVGAIRNLHHLLGSIRVGPKALARVIPHVQASFKPMVAAAVALAEAAKARQIAVQSVEGLGAVVTAAMGALDEELGRARKSSFRAGERLALEAALGRTLDTLDSALELVELLVEASAPGSVPVDIWDVVRESGGRPDAASGREQQIRLWWAPDSPRFAVRANPRLAVRLVSFAGAFARGREEGVEVRASTATDTSSCRLEFAARAVDPSGHSVGVALPPLIELSKPCVTDVAAAAGIGFSGGGTGQPIALSLPLAPLD